MEKQQGENRYKNIFLYILLPALIIVISCSLCAVKVPQSSFIQNTLTAVEDNTKVVGRFAGVTAAVSTAISALPNDMGTPLANSFASMDKYCVIILIALFLERLILVSGVKIAFLFIIPAACAIWGFGQFFQLESFVILSKKVMIIGLALFLVVPCSVQLTKYVGSDYLAYVDETIKEADDSAKKVNQESSEDENDQSVLDRIGNALKSAVKGVVGLFNYFENLLKKCINSIAILIITNFVMPLATFFIFRWLLKEIFALNFSIGRVKNFVKKETFHRKNAEED